MSPPVVPATNQAGEVERLRAVVEAMLLYADPSGDGLYDGANDIAGVKQNGALVLKGSFITTCIRARSALATQPATSQEGEALRLIRDTSTAVAGLDRDQTEEYYRSIARNALAATPTPPTLSEDLREALREIRDTSTAVAGLDRNQTEEYYRSIARAALAQVKAS